jgi:hypothetical protein
VLLRINRWEIGLLIKFYSFFSIISLYLSFSLCLLFALLFFIYVCCWISGKEKSNSLNFVINLSREGLFSNYAIILWKICIIRKLW